MVGNSLANEWAENTTNNCQIGNKTPKELLQSSESCLSIDLTSCARAVHHIGCDVDTDCYRNVCVPRLVGGGSRCSCLYVFMFVSKYQSHDRTTGKSVMQTRNGGVKAAAFETFASELRYSFYFKVNFFHFLFESYFSPFWRDSSFPFILQLAPQPTGWGMQVFP